jgi:hypothetical protein
LAAGVNRLSLSGMCVLVHDQYDGASIGVNKCTGSDNTYIGDAVIVDAFGIHGAVEADVDDSYINSCDASVRATVNECTMLLG